MTPLLQLNLGSKFTSQGYPKIRSSFPRSIIKNLILACFCPGWMLRSTYFVISPALLLVPSIFQIFWAHSRLWVPSLSLWISLGSMKLSVAPESTRMFLLALVYAVQNETGVFILRQQVIYTVLHLSVWMALPQAVRSELFKNPLSWRLPGWLCPSPLVPCCIPGLPALGLWFAWFQDLGPQGPLL